MAWVGLWRCFGSCCVVGCERCFPVLGALRVGLGVPGFSLGVARELLAGLSVWAPSFLLILGQSAGVLFVLGFRGGAETGRFYDALAIFTVISALSTVFVRLMMTVLSEMEVAGRGSSGSGGSEGGARSGGGVSGEGARALARCSF